MEAFAARHKAENIRMRLRDLRIYLPKGGNRDESG